MTDLEYLLDGDPDEQIAWLGHTTMYGGPVKGSRRSIAHLEATNAASLAEFGVGVVVIQSAYNTGVAASAGTHDLDKVYDAYIPGVDWWTQQRFFREQGWAAWYRYPPSFGDHVHMVSLGGTTDVGIYVPGQVADYYAHRTGLAGHAADDTWHPDDIASTIFDYDGWKAGQTDMFETDDKERLERIEAALTKLTADEKARALATKDRDRRLAKGLRVAVRNHIGAGPLGDLRETVEAIADELDQP